MRKTILLFMLAAVLFACSNEDDPIVDTPEPTLGIEGLESFIFGEATVTFAIEEAEVSETRVLIDDIEVTKVVGKLEDYTFDSNHYEDGDHSLTLAVKDLNDKEFMQKESFTVENTFLKSEGVVKINEEIKGFIVITDQEDSVVKVLEMTNNEPFSIKRWNADARTDYGIHLYYDGGQFLNNRRVLSFYGTNKNSIKINYAGDYTYSYKITIPEDLGDSIHARSRIGELPHSVSGSTIQPIMYFEVYKGGVPYALLINLEKNSDNIITATEEMLDHNVGYIDFTAPEGKIVNTTDLFLIINEISVTGLSKRFDGSTGSITYPESLSDKVLLRIRYFEPDSNDKRFFRYRKIENRSELSAPFSFEQNSFGYNNDYPVVLERTESQFIAKAGVLTGNYLNMLDWDAWDFGGEKLKFELPVFPDSINGFDLHKEIANGDFVDVNASLIEIKEPATYIFPDEEYFKDSDFLFIN